MSIAQIALDPPLCQTGKRGKKVPKTILASPYTPGQTWEKSASLRLNHISWYALWNLLSNQMEISQFSHFWLWLLFHIICGFASMQLLQTNYFFLYKWRKIFCLNIHYFDATSHYFSTKSWKASCTKGQPEIVGRTTKGGCQNNCHQNRHHHRIIVNSKILIKVPLQKAGLGFLRGLGMSR